MNDMTEVLLIDRVDVENSFPAGGVVEIWTINRTEKLNALNNEVMESIISACKAAENDDNVRVVIIRGAPPSVPDGDERPKPAAFVAGADIGEFTGKNSKQIRKVFSENVWEAIWNLSIPTIASIDGFALGGGRCA